MKSLSEQKFAEMIYAFSAGCLDAEENQLFVEYLQSGRNSKEAELGELQNVVSLLPAMLEIERPDIQVKDKVARRLYRLREEVRAKKKQSSKELPPEAVHPANENVFAEKVVEKKNVPPIQATGRMTIEQPAVQRENLENRAAAEPAIEISRGGAQYDRVEKPVPQPEIPLKDKSSFYAPAAGNEPVSVPVQEEEEEKRKPMGMIFFLAIALIVAVVASVVVYYLMNGELRRDKEQIASLSGQVNTLNNEIVRLDRNQKVLAVLSARELRTVNLDGTASNPGGFGKLTFLQNGKEGVIQFYNMPPLTNNKVYQLWLLSKGRNYSLGIFKPKREVEYFPLGPVPEVDQAEIDSYNVTLEDGEGKTSPSGKVYLTTTFAGR